MKKIVFAFLMLYSINTLAQDEISAHEVRENWKSFLFTLIIIIIIFAILVFRESERKRKGGI